MKVRKAPNVRGQRERHRQQLGELVRQPVVARVLGAVADELDDQREHRHRQHEGGEQQVELRRRSRSRPGCRSWGTAGTRPPRRASLAVLLLLLGALVGEPLLARRLGVLGRRRSAVGRRYSRCSRTASRCRRSPRRPTQRGERRRAGSFFFMASPAAAAGRRRLRRGVGRRRGSAGGGCGRSGRHGAAGALAARRAWSVAQVRR